MSDDKIARYELFLDESGTHEEGTAKDREQGFASQIAGLLAPAGTLDAAAARAALEGAGLWVRGQAHASAMRAGADFDRAVTYLLTACGARLWSPVRIVNRERAVFGDRATNYTNLLAELVVRVFERLATRDRPRVHLKITAARVLLAEDERGVLHFLDKADYRRRLDEQVARAALRRGHADPARRWEYALRIESARKRPELMLADLISNASHADGKKLGETARATLREALAPFDFPLWCREDVEAVRRSLDDGALGLALIRAADRLGDPDLDPKVGDQLRGLVHRAVADLAVLGPPARDPELQLVGSWLGQEVAHGRDHRRALATCRLLARDVAERLRKTVAEPAEAGWFAYLVHRTALTACNHLGDLDGARTALDALRPLEPEIAARFEHLALFVDAQHHEAVHRTDVHEFERATAIATRTARFFEEIGGLFQAAMPEHFPERVRARQRGEALGTAMQAAMYHGLVDPARFDEARKLSEAALDEFGPGPDAARQMQYRCQLETLAGEIDAAWGWLARALDLDAAAAPDAVATAVGALPQDSIGRQFLLLHAYRLGAAAVRAGHRSAAAFVDAFEPRFGADPLLRGGVDRHPAHAVLRYRAEVLLGTGADEAAAACVTALGQITVPLGARSPLLALHLVVAQARLAARFRSAEPARTRLLLDCTRTPRGLRQLVADLAPRVAAFAALRAMLAAWGASVDALRADPLDEATWQQLDGLARQIAH
jgi:hypothetical protein